MRHPGSWPGKIAAEVGDEALFLIRKAHTLTLLYPLAGNSGHLAKNDRDMGDLGSWLGKIPNSTTAP
jgi:hypothetical protein